MHPGSRKFIIFCLSISALIVLLDQVTKQIIVKNLDPFDTISVIDSCVNLVLVKNRGAAFGMMSQVREPIRSIVFSVLSLSALLFLGYIFKTRPKDSKLVPIAIFVILGGAIGNILDRIRLGYVIDFIDVYWKNFHWPAFNVADSCITVGVFLLIFHMILFDWRKDVS